MCSCYVLDNGKCKTKDNEKIKINLESFIDKLNVAVNNSKY